MRRLMLGLFVVTAVAVSSVQAPPVPAQKPPDEAETALRAAVAAAPVLRDLEATGITVPGVELGMVSWVTSAKDGTV